jgi:N-acetylmuramoyl-L-alanine amidase
MKPFLFVAAICSVVIFAFGYGYKESDNEIVDYSMYTVEPSKIPVKQEQQVAMVKEDIVEEDKESNEETEIIEEDVLIGSDEFGEEDALMLHKISVAEAGIKDVESMALVMLVVLNRTYSDDFPDTIEEVIFQKVNGIAQFSPTIDGNYEEAQPNEKSEEAMKLVLDGWDNSQGALYFEACKGKSWHSSNLKLLFEKDNIRYYIED